VIVAGRGADKYTSDPTHRVAVGAYIFDENGKLLLLLRRNPPRIFAPPGGRLRPDEDPREGLLREIREETSIEVELFEPVLLWFGRIVQDSPLYIGLDFIARAKTKEVKLSDEHIDFVWATWHDIESGVVRTEENGYGYAKKDIRKAFELFEKLIAKNGV